MASSFKLELSPNGYIKMLWNDQFDIKAFGPVEVTRASHVEFDNAKGKWYVQSAKTLKVLKDDFDSREQALAWEKTHYSPGGEGWKELTEEK